MSLPTLRNDLAEVYEPEAPAPSQRLAALRAAREAGLHVYAAVAPTYPECDEADLRATLRTVAEVEPVTIFHEPINIRAENVERITSQAKSLGNVGVADRMPKPKEFLWCLRNSWERISEWPSQNRPVIPRRASQADFSVRHRAPLSGKPFQQHITTPSSP